MRASHDVLPLYTAFSLLALSLERLSLSGSPCQTAPKTAAWCLFICFCRRRLPFWCLPPCPPGGVCCSASPVAVSVSSVFAASWVPSQFSPNFCVKGGGQMEGGGICAWCRLLYDSRHINFYGLQIVSETLRYWRCRPLGKLRGKSERGKLCQCAGSAAYCAPPCPPIPLFMTALSGAVYQLPPIRRLLKDLLHFPGLPFGVCSLTVFVKSFSYFSDLVVK